MRDLLMPELLTTLYYNRKTLRFPGTDPQLVADRIIERATTLDHIDDNQKEFVLLSIQHDRDRIAGLEGKGFAAAAIPGAIAAVAALLIGHGLGPTVFAIIALGYAACAVYAAALIILPRARETFSVKDALGSDPIKKLVIANDANRDLGIRANNLVNAALHDAACAAAAVAVAAIILLTHHLTSNDGTHGSPSTPSKGTSTSPTRPASTLVSSTDPATTAVRPTASAVHVPPR